MKWAWAATLDQLWHSPAFPMWLTLAAAAFFALIVLVTLLRAEKSVANGALTVITLLAIGIAVAATIRGFGSNSPNAGPDEPSAQIAGGTPAALSCIDDLAGETVLTACEKLLFGSPDTVAAAVSYATRQINRLSTAGDPASTRAATTEMQALRRGIERDRYGLIAYVLSTRDRCTPLECPAFRFLTDRRQVAANMDARQYEALIIKYSPTWNAPPASSAAAASSVAGLPASLPTGKPTNADFPSSASTPPVSIMTAEPAPGARAASPTAAPSTTAAAAPASSAAKKKQAATKPGRTPAPVQLTPKADAPAEEAE